MTIRTSLLTTLLLMGGLAAALALWLAAGAWDDARAARRVDEATLRLSALAAVREALVREAVVLTDLALAAPGAADAPALARLRAAGEASAAALAPLLRGESALAAEAAAGVMAPLRAALLEAAAQPRDERARALNDALPAALEVALGQLGQVAAGLSRAAAAGAPGAAAALGMAAEAQTLFETMSRRSMMLSLGIAGGALGYERAVAATALGGRVAEAWSRLRAAAAQAGEAAPALGEASAALAAGLMAEGEETFAALVAAARDGLPAPMTYAQFRDWAPRTLAAALVPRDAALAEAAAQAGAQAAA
ncbi:hypothetical protein NON00_16310, partial [Roseomonas sp. GC11]|uniref:hypothetical protein n=1 Tax=Roseomonas sp. GC11 TaxID=2950546 RepID=UPI00351EA0CB|nr:hypothetical protein [Roseomonas sp. GC11]